MPRRSVNNPAPSTDNSLLSKNYYNMREAVILVGEPDYTLRYWEKNFPCIKPHHSTTSHRRYRRRDIELFIRIKELIKNQKYSVPGAWNVLKEELAAEQIIKGPLPTSRELEIREMSHREKMLTARRLATEILDLVRQ